MFLLFYHSQYLKLCIMLVKTVYNNYCLFSDGTFAWLFTGRYLEAFSTQNGQRIAAWSFGTALKDPHTLITCCCELSNVKCNKFLVGTECTASFLLTVFDVKTSRVSKAIRIPEKVRACFVFCGLFRLYVYTQKLLVHLLLYDIQ